MTSEDDNYATQGYLPMHASSSDLTRLEQELTKISQSPGNNDLLKQGEQIPDKLRIEDYDKLQKASIKPEHLEKDPIPLSKVEKPSSPRKN